MRGLYECLLGMRLIGISANDLKQIFEDEALICGLDNTWYTARDCLWSSTTTIRGKLVLNSLYGDLRDFFVGSLGISELTPELVYDKLTAQDGPELSIEEAKETLVAFNAFLSAGSGTKGFALMDRKLLGEDFAAVAKFLDFGMDEIRILQPLIQWLGLGDRYLSSTVKEITCADRESTRPISFPHRDIRRKAHALLRPRASYDQNELYALLRNSETLETEAITAELSLNQDNKVLKVTKESASLHIQHDTDGLKIYVPRDRRNQEVCFNSKLPRRLCEWMMADPTTQIAGAVSSDAVTVIQSVLSAQPFALDDILDEHGIVEADIDEDDTEIPVADEDYDEEGDAETENTGAGANDDLLARPETPPSRETPPSAPSSNNTPGMATPPSSVASPEVISASYVTTRSNHAVSRPRLRPMDAYGVVEGPGDSYSSLLQNVVDHAERAGFPSRGVFDMSVLDAALSGSPGNHGTATKVFRLLSTSGPERDKQVGAAGELFVFEMLSRLQPRLTGFSQANWESTIRHYASAHPNYANMTRWTGKETADITYHDVDGVFTSLLIDKGYLDAGTWAHARPRYFIEVKTTTGSYRTPFFMSKYQYQRMHDNSHHDNSSCDTVYVIFRVFKLGTDDTGVRILVDPESMRLRNELSFTAESWSVVPAA
ncbi:hypothetical protein NEMBOFW57_010706 [Staphylotrichum longicolle]|uniref:Protein NO VEIN C-terminal domain-containing protein n=1 Tax=Staphylotrichum longicolle TaxID=669026 RepID=A0AAD4ENH9_9PEZI|nr:hypothetical protein NEMBOFW57_010706 [Staphylotrichum longicolle]